MLSSVKRLSFQYPSREVSSIQPPTKIKKVYEAPVYPPKQLKNVLEYDEDEKVGINRQRKKDEEYKIILKYPINNSLVDEKNKKKRNDITNINILNPPSHYCISIDDEKSIINNDMEEDRNKLTENGEIQEILLPKYKSIEYKYNRQLLNDNYYERESQYLGYIYIYIYV